MKKTPQVPIRSGYGATTTAREVIEGRRLDGKVAIVTGGYVGVGLETTRALADAGATVVVPARTLDKARAALSAIPRVELDGVDLAEPPSVDAFAARVPRLRAAASSPRQQRRHHGRAVCQERSRLRAPAGDEPPRPLPAHRCGCGLRCERRTALASSPSRHEGTSFASVDLEDPNFERRPYDKWNAYGQSKTRERALRAGARRARRAAGGARLLGASWGGHDRAHALDPRGGAPGAPRGESADLQDTGAGRSHERLVRDQPAARRHGRRLLRGRRHRRGAPRGNTETRGVRPWAMDPALAERLWTASESWGGVRFGEWADRVVHRELRRG